MNRSNSFISLIRKRKVHFSKIIIPTIQYNYILSRDIIIPGYAVPSATKQFFDTSTSTSSSSLSVPIATTILPRSQWTVSRISYGLDDYGLPLTERMKSLRNIILKKQGNFILFDGNALLQRYYTVPSTSTNTNTNTSRNRNTKENINSGATLMSTPFIPPIERSILHELLQNNEQNITRSQLVIGIQLSALPSLQGISSSSSPSATNNTSTSHKLTIEEQLELSLQYILKLLGLSTIDVLILHFPQQKSLSHKPNNNNNNNDSLFQLLPERGPKLVNYLSWLESCVGKGYIQYYGLNIDILGGITSAIKTESSSNSTNRTSATSSSSASSSNNLNNHMDDVYIRLEQLLFASLGRIKGQAKKIRQETISLGNRVDFFTPSETSSTVPSVPANDDHHLLMLLSPGNLLRWGPLLPRSSTRSNTSAKGYETWSQIIASHSISQFIHHPLDIVYQNKAFRCTGLKLNTMMKNKLYQRTSLDKMNKRIMGNHPADIAPYLQDSLNISIQLEIQYDTNIKNKLLMIKSASMQTLPPRTGTWARILGSNLSTIDSSMTWSFMKHAHILPSIEKLNDIIVTIPSNQDKEIKQWFQDYQKNMYDIISFIDILMGQNQAERENKVIEILQQQLSLSNESLVNLGTSSDRKNTYENLTSLIIPLLLNNEGNIQGIFTEIPEAYGNEPNADISQYPYRIVVPELAKHTPSSSTTAPSIAQPLNTNDKLLSTFTPLQISKLLTPEVYDKLLEAMFDKSPSSI